MHIAQREVAEYDLLHWPDAPWTNPHLKIASHQGVRYYVNIDTFAV